MDRDEYTPAHRLAALESISQYQFSDVRRLEQRHVAVEDQLARAGRAAARRLEGAVARPPESAMKTSAMAEAATDPFAALHFS